MEVAHIEPFKKVREHRFENLIALCPNCHTRYDNGQIDRKSMLQYKTNLTVLNSRYNELERRLLEMFAANPDNEAIGINSNMTFEFMYLLRDEIIENAGVYHGTALFIESSQTFLSGVGTHKYKLTTKGRKFLEHWINARGLD